MSANILQFPQPQPQPAQPIDDEPFAQLRSLNDDVKLLWEQNRKMYALLIRIRSQVLDLGAARKQELANG